MTEHHPDGLSGPADADPGETREWLDALEAVIEQVGPERAHYLIEQLIALGHRAGINIPYAANTDYVNTIPVDRQPLAPGDYAIENRIRSYIRWNALAMVLRANKGDSNLGGHIASFASAATLYDVGFQHFWHAPSEQHGGDLVFIQGHSAPGVYARAFMLGRLTEEQLDGFRQDVDGKGVTSYPHPWLMPDFWQFPTVSMGLGPLQAIYQARFMKYLDDRGLAKTAGRKVWAFMGDGETDEVESLGAIGMAGREKLDNLIFVINCNLQRLDGPVRGNGKIIQELEADFRGAGWNVIKVIWGSYWDALLAQDKQGLLRKRMMECVDGDYQTFKSKDGAYVREHFFNTPELKAMVASLSDADIWRLNRGGHDPHKVYAAYHAAVHSEGMPTVILAKTVKGYGMGDAGESQNITHQQKKMDTTAVRAFRDRFNIPIADDKVDEVPYYHPGKDSPEVQYLRARREALNGPLPSRRRKADHAPAAPALDALKQITQGTGEREISTTMAFVRGLNLLLRDKDIGPRIVPIVADEARTFGMEGMFRQIGIYAPFGQKYRPQDADQLMYYREDQSGQVLQEGISEAGGMAAWMAAASSYSFQNVPMLPVFIYYSMFGFQRVGDLAWAAGDMRCRGFLIGGTAGRTTLNGEGLQHEDGHSHLLAAAIPNCHAYDPTFSYEVAVILQDGVRRMLHEQEDAYWYITVMNENYAHPDMPEGVAGYIVKGMYRFRAAEGGKAKGKGGKGDAPRVQLLGSGTIFREVIAAADLLEKDFGVKTDLWSCPSFTELARDGMDCERHNRLNPLAPARASFVEQQLEGHEGPLVAATDYVRAFPEQIRAYLPPGRRYVTLGTDGFGRSDTRAHLRDHFEVDRRWIAHAALAALAAEGTVRPKDVARAIELYGLDPAKPLPLHA